jgi:hypothetical protein
MPATKTASLTASTDTFAARTRVAALPRIVRVHWDETSREWILSGREDMLDPWVQLARLPGCGFDFAYLLWDLHRLARAVLVERNAKDLGATRRFLAEHWRGANGQTPAAADAAPEVVEFVAHALHDAKVLLDMEPAVLWDVLYGRGVR